MNEKLDDRDYVIRVSQIISKSEDLVSELKALVSDETTGEPKVFRYEKIYDEVLPYVRAFVSGQREVLPELTPQTKSKKASDYRNSIKTASTYNGYAAAFFCWLTNDVADQKAARFFDKIAVVLDEPSKLPEFRPTLAREKVTLAAPLVKDRESKTFEIAAQAELKSPETINPNCAKREGAQNTILLNEEILSLNPTDTRKYGIESFQYARRQDDYIDRDGLLTHLLNNFLDFDEEFDRQNAFKWTLIYGEAGSGKSRFALELLSELYKQHGSKFLKKHWGFVKRDSSDASQSLSVEKINSWHMEGPAFIVLDYAGTNRDLAASVSAMKARSILLEQPVRLMLLERRNDSGRLADLDRIDTEESFLRNTCFSYKQSLNEHSIGIKLRPLKDDDAIELMVKRINRERGDLFPHESSQYLLDRLDEISPGERRPLFAAMVASAIADESSSSAQERSNSDQRQRRSSTIHYLVRRERDKFWRSGQSQDELSTLGKHENLLALSTFARGLDLSVLADADGRSACQIPSHDDFEQERYLRMATSSQKYDLYGLPIGFLEPDFIGEWFTLSRLSPQARIEVDVPINRPSLREFLEIAWSHGRERAGQFVRQCHQNYPDEVHELGYLLPKPGAFCEFVIPLLRDLLLDWRRELARLREIRGMSISYRDGALICERAKDVFNLLRRHVDALSDIPRALYEDISDATESYAFIQCWAISPTVRTKRDDRLDTSFADQTNLRKRSLIEASFSIQEQLNSTLNISITQQRSSDTSIVQSSALALADQYNRKRSGKDGRPFYLPPKSPPGGSANQINRLDATEPTSEPYAYDLAAKLLSDAAGFFVTLGEQNPPLAAQMEENSSVFSQMASILVSEPEGSIRGTSNGELAGNLLRDAAAFFRSIADQNPPIEEQMRANADVYETIGNLVKEDPLAHVQ